MVERTSRTKALTLAAMSLGYVVVQLDVTIVNVALQHIGSSVGGGVSGLQWVVNAYTVVFAALILTAGAAGDRFGARRVFITGFAIFVVASLGAGIAPSLFLLIFARALQGLGAAILVPSSLALLNHAYPSDEERTHAVGVWAAGASVALAAGPVIGGVLIAAIGWRSIFFINLPIGLIGIWLTWRYAEETTRTQTRELDLPGQGLAIFALADVAAAMIEGGKAGWTHPAVLAGYALFAAAAAAFVVVEGRSKSPMLPLSLFRERTFSASTLIGLLINIAYYGLIFVLSLFFQEIKNYTALRTGLAFLPMTAIVLASNLSAARVTARFGPRLPILFGQAVFVAGCVCLLWVTPGTPYFHMAFQLLAIGGGLGLVVPPLTSVLLGTVEKKRSGIASGVLNSSRQAGSVMGVSLFGSLIAQKTRFLHGFHASLLISAVVVLIGCFLALLIQARKKSSQIEASDRQAT